MANDKYFTIFFITNLGNVEGSMQTKSAVLHLLLLTISDLKHWDIIHIVNIFLHYYLPIS